MSTTYKEVSLGFSEFVSELIHETFDAILSSQNYQLEKYAELESKINLSNEQYRKLYITEEEIKERSLDFFDFTISPKMIVNENFNNFISENMSDHNENLVYKKRLTNYGFNALQAYIANLIIDEQKSIMETLLNGANATKLIVDSGEIIAKLELNNLYMSEDSSEASNEAEGSRRMTSDIRDRPTLPTYDEINEKMHFLKKEKLGLKEIVDTSTGKSTIIVNKEELKNKEFISNKIPNFRMTVKPTKLSTKSDLFTQVKINFKTV